MKPLLVFIVVLISGLLYRLTRTKTDIGEIGDSEIKPSGGSNMPGTENFKLSEFDCNDGTKVPAEYYGNVMSVMLNLETLRRAAGGKKITITSGYRTKAYNDTITGAAVNSMHLVAGAADFVVEGLNPKQVVELIFELIDNGSMNRGGIGNYSTFTHYDIGRYRTW